MRARFRGLCPVSRLSAGLAALLVILCAGSVFGGRPAALSEMTLKSAFLYNFARFVTWPDTTWLEQGEPMVFGVIGADSLVPELEQAVQGKMIQGHPLQIRRLTGAAGLAGCHVVFIGSEDRSTIQSVMGYVEKRAILTVGDSREFARQGGMITFVQKGNTLGFEINNGVAELAGLRVSSRLLNLAMVVPR